MRVRRNVIGALLAATLVLAGVGACAGEDCDAEDRRERDPDCGYVTNTRPSTTKKATPTKATPAQAPTGKSTTRTAPVKRW